MIAWGVPMGDGPGQTVAALLRAMLHARRTLGHVLASDDPSDASPFTDRENVSAWFRHNRHEILTAAHEVFAQGDPLVAASFLTSAWALVPADIDNGWCDRLRDCEDGLSSTAPESPELAAVFRQAAATYYARGDYRFAESEGLHELAVWRALEEPDEHVAALDSLARTFLARDRLHRAMDCADERLAVHIQHHRHRDIAADLQRLGALMMMADRPETAVDYLTRARDAFDELPDITAQQHAKVRVLLGRALWLTGGEAAARRQFSNALGLLVDVDDHAAGQIRALLSTPTGGAASGIRAAVVKRGPSGM